MPDTIHQEVATILEIKHIEQSEEIYLGLLCYWL